MKNQKLNNIINNVRMSQKTIKNHIQENPLPWLIQTVSVVALIVSLYITSRLAPLAKDLKVVATRVEAIEKHYVSDLEYRATLISIERRLTNIEDILKNK